MREPTDRPNIVLIQCEDLGYGDLGCYGSRVNDTPALDRLAAQGVRFADCNSTAPICTPARVSLLTGCYANRAGLGVSDHQSGVCFPGHHYGLNPDEISIARLLRDQGYATGMVGKWHAGDQPEFLPTRHGFDSYYGIPFSNDMGIQAGGTDRPPLPLLLNEEVLQEQPDQAALHERYVEQCVRFVREKRASPFFLYYAPSHMHVPIYAAERFLRESRNGAYGAAMASVDWSVAVLMHELQQLGLRENTIVVFTADHGSRNRTEGGSNKPCRGHKGQNYEGGSRVPAIASWPGQFAQGHVCEELITGMDWLPTLAALAGAQAPTDRVIDGQDIRPLLRADPGAVSPHETLAYYRANCLDAVRKGPWKLHLKEASRGLYDLSQDMSEERNLLAEQPEKVAELEELAEAFRQELGDRNTGAVGSAVRPPGYVENAKPLTQHNPEYPYIEPVYLNPMRG
jgi:arylsulfatase A-like enzyme